MVEELNGGKIMYAVCRVQDPNTNLPKIVFVNWVCKQRLKLDYFNFAHCIIFHFANHAHNHDLCIK